MIDRLSTDDVDMVVGTRFAEPGASKPPLLKRIILRIAAVLSPSSRALRLTDAHNGLTRLQQEGRRRAEHHDERHEPRE